MRTFFEWGGGLAVGGCLFLFVSTSTAAYFDAGNEIYEKCIAPENTSNRLICLATATAYLDMMRELGYSCTGDNLTRRQVADVLAKFFRENPESRQEPGHWRLRPFQKDLAARSGRLKAPAPATASQAFRCIVLG